MNKIIYLNGEFCRAGDVGVSVYDSGFLYGEGLFETVRTYNEKLFLLNEHIKRMKNSGKQLGIPVHLTAKQVQGIITRLSGENKMANAVFRITVTAGHATMAHGRPERKQVEIISPRELHPSMYSLKRLGVEVIISRNIRDANNIYFRHKTLNYMQNIHDRREAFAQKTFESLYMNTKGHVAEGTISNIFIIKNGTIYTPPLEDNILSGITRDFIIKLCKDVGVKAKESFITMKKLKAADEVFLSNSIFEIMPVKGIKGKARFGKPGRMTTFLQEAYYAARKRRTR